MDLIIHQFSTKMLDNINMNADVISESKNIDALTCFAVQYIWSGFVTGTSTVSIECSNDDINYTPLDTYVISSESDNRMLNVEKAGYSFIRIVYTQSSSVGNLTVIANGKVI